MTWRRPVTCSNGAATSGSTSPTCRLETLVDGTPFRWGKEFRFVDPDGGLLVELRFGFIGGSRSDAEIFSDLWKRRTSSTLTGRTLSTLSPEDRALLLLVHGTKHGWRQLSWVYDIALIYKQDIDWEVVLTRAKTYRWLRAVLYGSAVMTELTGCRFRKRSSPNSSRRGCVLGSESDCRTHSERPR